MPNIAYPYHDEPRITEMQIHVDSVELFISVCRAMGGGAQEVSRCGNLATVQISYAEE